MYKSNPRTLMSLTLLAAGLLFSCLLSSCLQEATFVLPNTEVVTPPPGPPPTIFKLPAGANFVIHDTVEPGQGHAPGGAAMRVAVGWETVKPDGTRGLTFYYSARLIPFSKPTRADHYEYTLTIADSLPLNAVLKDSAYGVGSAIAVGHLFVTDNPRLVDSAFIDSASFFPDGVMPNVYAGSFNAVIVLRLGDPIVPMTGLPFDPARAIVPSGSYTGLYGGYDKSKNFYYLNIPTSGIFSRPFRMDDDRNAASNWNKIAAWFW